MTTATANNTNNQSSPKHNQSNELPLDLSSPNTKNLLNQMLTKQFQKNHHLNNSKRIDESRSLVNHDGNDDDDEDDKSIIKKIIENLSFYFIYANHGLLFFNFLPFFFVLG